MWEKLEQTDLREGTHPENSVWRPVGKVVWKSFVIRYFANLEEFPALNISGRTLFEFQLSCPQATMSSACVGMYREVLRFHFL